MTSEGIVTIIGATTALVVAIAGLIHQLHELRRDMNGRMSQLVETAALAANSLGQAEGRAVERRALDLPPVPPRGGE